MRKEILNSSLKTVISNALAFSNKNLCIGEVTVS